MSFRVHSEMPIPALRGGNARTGRDQLNCMHFNMVWDGSKYICFWRGAADKETDPSPRSDVLMRGVIDPAGEPSDILGMLRTVDTSSNPTQSDGDDYIFGWDDGIGNITGWGTLPVDGLTKNADFSVEEYDNVGTPELRILVAYPDHPSDSKKHLGVLKSTDWGLNWTVVGDATLDGGVFTESPGGLFAISNVFYMLVNDGADGKKLVKSTDGGMTWASLHTVIQQGATEDWPDYTNIPIGRAVIRDNVIYSFQNASKDDNDWPKHTLMYYRPVADVETVGTWDSAYFPVNGCHPANGGEWQLSAFDLNGTTFAVLNAWGGIGRDWVGSSDQARLQTQEYYLSQRERSFKSVYVRRLRWTGLWDNPSYKVLDDGDVVRIKSVASGRYLAPSAAGQPVKMQEAPADWTVSLQVRFALLQSDGLYLEFPEDVYRPNQSPICSALVDDEPGDYRKHWFPLLEGAGTPTQFALMNRVNRFVLRHNGLMGPDTGSNADLFEVEYA